MFELYYRLVEAFRNTYTARIAWNFFDLAFTVGPYFIVSVFLNASIRRYFTNRKILSFFGNETLTVLVAGLIGLISPLPTYLAVPMGISLLSTGIPLSAVAAFAVASPLMNPGIFYLTWTQLGLEIAVARVISALALALIAGLLAKLAKREAERLLRTFTKEDSGVARPFWEEFKRSLAYLGKYFVLGLLISAVVKALVPAEVIGRILGGHVSMSLVIAIALGVPFYSCGGAAIPLIQTLSEMGMNKGAVLAFFIAGPATKAETMYVYKSVLGFKIFFCYLAFTLVGAFVCGLIMLKA